MFYPSSRKWSDLHHSKYHRWYVVRNPEAPPLWSKGFSLMKRIAEDDPAEEALARYELVHLVEPADNSASYLLGRRRHKKEQ